MVVVLLLLLLQCSACSRSRKAPLLLKLHFLVLRQHLLLPVLLLLQAQRVLQQGVGAVERAAVATAAAASLLCIQPPL